MRAFTAVVVNWETADLTLRAARALIGDEVDPGDIVVVDNGSKDDSYERLVEELPDSTVIRVEENIGYGRAANLGARTRPAREYLMLNNDAFVHRPGSVRALREALQSSSVGLVAPRVLNEDLTLQPTVSSLQTPAVALVRASGLSRLIPNRWQPSWSTHWDHGSSREIQGAAGVVMLVRGETWERLGGWDERIYFYAEDFDLCLRTRQAGWRVWFTSEAEFVHLGSSSTATRWESPDRAEMIGQSEGMMLRRNLRPSQARLSLFFITSGLSARTVVFRTLGRRQEAVALAATRRGYRTGIAPEQRAAAPSPSS